MVDGRILYVVKIPKKFIKGNKNFLRSGVIKDTIAVLTEEIKGV